MQTMAPKAPALWLLFVCVCACSGEPGAESNTTVPLYSGPLGSASTGTPPTGTAPTGMAAGGASQGQAPLNPSPGATPEGGAAPSGLSPGAGGAGAAAAGGTATGSGGMAAQPPPMLAAAGSAGTMSMPPAPMGAAGAPNLPPANTNCPATALFCDDFEDDAMGQFPGAPWQNQTGSGGTVRVDGMQAFSGSRAVHVNAPPGQAYRRAYFSLLQTDSEIFPAASRQMFGRMMVWLDATPNATVHWTLIQAEGRAANGTHDAYYRYGGQQQGGAGFMANYETNMGVSTDCYSHSATRMPTQNWACVEWRFAVASNEMQFWLNGNEVSDLHVTDRPTSAGAGCLGNGVNGEWLAPPNFTTLHLGWEQYQQHSNDTNLWVDDVAISTERIGCPAP